MNIYWHFVPILLFFKAWPVPVIPFLISSPFLSTLGALKSILKDMAGRACEKSLK